MLVLVACMWLKAGLMCMHEANTRIAHGPLLGHL